MIASTVVVISVLLTTAGLGADPSNTIVEPPGARSTDASAISDVGSVVGRFDDGRPGAFVMTADGEFEIFRIQDAGQIVVVDVNEAGVVAGYFAVGPERRGFLRSNDGTFTTIRVPGSETVQIDGINDAGVAVGHSRAPSGRTTGFTRSSEGVLTTIEIPGAAHTVAQVINDLGDVAGFYDSRTGDTQGFVRFADGTLRSFSTPTGGGLSISAIDEEGNVAGWYADRSEVRRAFFRSTTDEVVTVLPTGATESVATDLDRSGRLAGYFRDTEGTVRGFVRSRLGVLTVIDVDGSVSTSVTALGSDGTIVGNSRGSGTQRGFITHLEIGPDDATRPAPPYGLRTARSELAVDLRWLAGDDIGVTYQVYRSSDGSLGQLVASVGDTSYRDDAVQPGVTYTYAIKSVSPSGVSSWRSNLAEVAAGAGVPAPADGVQRLDDQPDQLRPTPPTGLQAAARPWGIELTWNPSSDDVGVTGYVIHRSTDGTFGEPWRTVGADQLGFPHGQAEAGVTYTYAVRAVDAAGHLSWRSNLSTASLG